MTDKPFTPSFFIRDLWPVLLVSLGLWAVLPGLYAGNLHTDTLEAAYWGRDLAWGYSKHPPLVSFLINAVLRPGTAPILTLLLLGQGLAFVSAWYAYDLVGTIAGRANAILAACLMMVTSVATFYSLQLNHNSVLVPFCAATLAHGYHYLDKRRWRDAVGLGLAVGLGALTKYEIIFAVMPLLVLCLVMPRFRNVYLSPKSWLSVLIAVGLFAPHVYWLSSHGWSSLSRAVGSAPMDGVGAALFSLWGLVIGFLAIASLPLILIATTQQRSGLFRSSASPVPDTPMRDTQSLGRVFLVVPLIGVVLASLVTDQFIKALWLLPLTPSTMIGLTLIAAAQPSGDPALKRKTYRRSTVSLSVVMSVLFHLYMVIGDSIDMPLESYLADTRPVSDAAQQLWSEHSTGPLTCIVSDESKLSISPVLWIASRPQILPLSVEDWLTKDRQARCASTGGIAVKFVLDQSLPVTKKFPRACVADARHVHVASVFGFGKTGWDAELIYIPPDAQPDCPP